jgi:opacity protein-like surface antigen
MRNRENASMSRQVSKQLLGFVAAALVLSLAGAPRTAQAQAASSPDGGWSFEFTPYLWGAAMSGEVGAGQLPTIGVDMSFSDILDNLDSGLMGAFEARKGRWGLLFDAIYMKLEHSGTASRTGAGSIGATATASANLEMAQTMFAAGVAYRAIEGRTPLDVIGGVRYAKIEADAQIDGSFYAQTASVSRSAAKSWVDPYVGVRALHPIAERWTLVGYADIGGFGVGSDFTWQAAAGVNYEFSKAIAGKFGYRYMSVDYDKDGFRYDMANSGLYLGVGIRF